MARSHSTTQPRVLIVTDEVMRRAMYDQLQRYHEDWTECMMEGNKSGARKAARLYRGLRRHLDRLT